MTQRSTKGASKQRRDAINDRIAQIREQLPVSEAVRSRLSQLQVMALTNAFITKSNFFADFCFDVDDRSTTITEHFDFTQCLPGFLLIANVDGRILYITDNVSDYLGNSAVDTITQMESIYDIIDERDRDELRQAMAQHQQSSSPTNGEPWMQDICQVLAEPFEPVASELSFTCRMNSSATRCVRSAAMQSMTKASFERQKTMQVTGRFLRPRSMIFGSRMTRNPHLTTVFVACCVPHVSATKMSSGDVVETSEADTMTFRSLHQMDMKFVKTEPNGEYHLGYDQRTVFGKSWYEMIHPEDIEEAQRKHLKLTNGHHAGDMTSSQSLCVRVQTATGRFLWLHVIMRVENYGDADFAFGDINGYKPMIACTNHVIDEMAARYLRKQENEMQVVTDCENYHVVSTMVCRSDDQQFNGVQCPVFETAAVQNLAVLPASVCRENERQDVHQQLRRKICDRRLEQTGDVRRSKIPRPDNVLVTDVATAEANVMSVCSMPSPPMQQWDYHAIPSAGSFGQSSRSPSVFTRGNVGVGNVEMKTAFDFQTDMSVNGTITTAGQANPVPDSILTPISSPALASTTDQDDLDELMMMLPDDSSFFPINHPTCTTADIVPQKHIVAQNVSHGQWNAVPEKQLPVLDQHCIASVLGDPDLLTPTASLTSEFGFKSDSRRQQLSGGHVIVVNAGSQSNEFGRSAVTMPMTSQPQHQQFMISTSTSGVVMSNHHSGNIVDQFYNEQLITNLLALGEDFLQILASDAADPVAMYSY